MNRVRSHHILKLFSKGILFFLVINFTPLAFSQQKKVKKDSISINDSISGSATYEYDESLGEDVYDGQFNFQSVSESQQDNFDFEAHTYEGVYSSNKKNGSWSYSDKKMKAVNQRFVSDFRIGKLASGTENKVSGEFKEGKAVGDWKAVKQDYIESEVKDTLFLVESTFKNNQLTGALRSSSKSIVIQGYFNADGYFHGKWEIQHKDDSVQEYRTYEAGILQAYEVVVDDKSFDISYTGLDTTLSDDEQWEDFTLQEGYFDILSLVDLEVEQSVSSSIQVSIDEYHKKTNQFIKNSVLALSYNSDFDIWESLRGSERLGLGKFKVRKFEYSTKEKERVESIAQNFDEIKSILKKFADNPKVKIGKPVYEKFNEVELIFSVYRNEMSQLENLVQVIRSDAFEFINREDIYNQIWPKLQFPVEVTYEFQSELITKTHEFPKPPERENFDLMKAEKLIQDILDDVKALETEAEEIFKAMEIEKSLSKDEEKLIAKKDEIESLFDINSEEESFNAYHERFTNKVIELANQTFNDYGNLSVDNKKARIKDLLKCYDGFIDFYPFLEDLEAKDDRLDDAYTNTTFNPYMMVDMSERIKENIYVAFEDHLRPYLLDELEKNISCESINPAMETMNEVYQKMLDLSKKDTRDEERQLKRQKDPEAILSVLEVEMKF